MSAYEVINGAVYVDDHLDGWVWDFWRWQYFHCLIDAPNEYHQAVGAEIPDAVADALDSLMHKEFWIKQMEVIK